MSVHFLKERINSLYEFLKGRINRLYEKTSCLNINFYTALNYIFCEFLNWLNPCKSKLGELEVVVL